MEGPPLCIVLGGPNGAGKSTAASTLLPHDLRFLNADEVAKTLPGYPSARVDLLAGRLLLEALDRAEAARESFAVETTLASKTLAPRIARLRRSNYRFRLIFLWSPDPEFSVRRVEERVRLGGHSVPEETIRRRYVAGLRNLHDLYIPLADEWFVYNNTGLSRPGMIASGTADNRPTIIDGPSWARILERGGKGPTSDAQTDLRTATAEEMSAAIWRGVKGALRRHKRAGVPAITWDHEANRIVEVAPEDIPDFPDDDDEDDATHGHRPG